MERLPDAWAERVNQEFETWEGLRRQLTEREACWAAAVTTTDDDRRLAVLRGEVARLQDALDEVFYRAMGALEQGRRSARTD
ncbi:MAG: hypothetical protein ACO1OY_06350 [Ramlibacter sp.]